MRRVAAVAVACTILLIGARATADPGATDADPIHLLGGIEGDTPGGTHLILPPGYYLSEPDWGTLDAEIRRLQEQETRLTAERNKALQIAKRSSSPVWVAVLATVLGGILGAIVAAR